MSDVPKFMYGLLGLLAVMAVASTFWSKGMTAGVRSSAQSLESQFEEMKREAKATYPNKPTAIALSDLASVQTARDLANTQDPDLRAAKAASIFMGFYLVNVRARLEYCRQKGVDISTFSSSFASAWRPAHGKAVEVLARSGIDEEQIWKQTRGVLMSAVAIDMGSIGFVPGYKSACDVVNAKAQLIIDKLDINKKAPEAMRILMGS